MFIILSFVSFFTYIEMIISPLTRQSDNKKYAKFLCEPGGESAESRKPSQEPFDDEMRILCVVKNT